MPFSLLPREEEFFALFVEVARRSHQAATHLVALFNEPDKAAYHTDQIKRLEHECDQFTHEVVNRLDRTARERPCSSHGPNAISPAVAARLS